MATNFVNCSYQEIIDLHTESDHVTVLGVHTPTGSTPRKMFSGFFDQFKKYKYNGCSIKLVPAARLPVDPLQVGVEPGQVYETPMDPRDALNPIMFHGCHGNDMGEILDMLYGSQDISESMKGLDATTIGGTVLSQAFYDVMERLYYKALTDNTWKKAHPQRGFKKAGLRPLVYSVAANRQIAPGALGDMFSLGENDEIIQEMGDLHQFTALDSVKVDKSNLQFFTPRLTSLGWLDTRNALTTEDAYDGTSTSLDDLLNKFTNYTELPSIFMGCILLPPAYGVEQYFRMIINHSFSFKNFRGISFKPEVSSVPSYYDANADLFDPDQYEGGEVTPTPDPDPDPDPEPEPTPTTATVGFGISGSPGGSTAYFYALTYTLNGETTTIATFDPDSSTRFRLYSAEVPVGAVVGGTYYTGTTTHVYGALQQSQLIIGDIQIGDTVYSATDTSQTVGAPGSTPQAFIWEVGS